MRVQRILTGAILVNLLVCSATAETLVVRPDPCPFAADAPKIITLGNVEADDLNPDRARTGAGTGDRTDHVIVVYPMPLRGWASARLLSRFDVEGAPRRRPRGC